MILLEQSRCFSAPQRVLNICRQDYVALSAGEINPQRNVVIRQFLAFEILQTQALYGMDL